MGHEAPATVVVLTADGVEVWPEKCGCGVYLDGQGTVCQLDATVVFVEMVDDESRRMLGADGAATLMGDAGGSGGGVHGGEWTRPLR